MSEIIQAQQKARPIIIGILRHHRDDVDDVLQNAAIRALENSNQFRGEAKFSTWFIRIAIRSALMHIRSKESKYRRLSVSIEDNALDWASTDETPEELAIRWEKEDRINQKVHKAIRQLTPVRKIAVSRWLHGEHVVSCAEKSARHQGRIQMRRLLGGLA